MVSPLEIKRSLGIVSGNNDKVDAQRIAEYAYLKRGQLKIFVKIRNEILKAYKRDFSKYNAKNYTHKIAEVWNSLSS